ncbi:MAG: 2Fe-2S iron-sulfur cluster-binding protein [Zestosphaera sp.]
MVKVYVSGVEVEVLPNSPIIDAVEKAGFRVPTLCYLQGLFNEATCRICVVKVNGRVVPACRFPLAEGSKVIVEDDELRRIRRVNFELLLSTHRIECWSCVRKGRCELLGLAKDMGVEGIPVCAECPLHGPNCLLSKGILCLGALTVAGCNAECVRKGSPCIGCRGYVESEGVWRDAIEGHYKKHGFNTGELSSMTRFFWNYLPRNLRRFLEVEPR